MARVQDELSTQTQSLLQGHVELYHHSLCYLKSMALRCAADLGIPGAIHRRGGAATLSDLVDETALHKARLPHLRRLMRVLTVSGIFAANQPSPGSSGEVVYTLTPASRLLVGDRASRDMSAFLRFIVHPTTVTSFFSLEAWFRDDRAGGAAATALFETAHGIARLDMTKKDDVYNKSLNDMCTADSSFAMEVLLGQGGDVFCGLSSLVDVGGGHGAAAAAIARAFPHIKCTVLDHPHVINQAPADGKLQFVAGDMFESVPSADAVLLKYVLDCWGHDECVKILRKCKEAIPASDAGGKVIIINAVVGSEPRDNVVKEAQVLLDLYMMYVDGVEREEHEWKKVFLDAGFSDYKIVPTVGFVSIIEVYP